MPPVETENEQRTTQTTAAEVATASPPAEGGDAGALPSTADVIKNALNGSDDDAAAVPAANPEAEPDAGGTDDDADGDDDGTTADDDDADADSDTEHFETPEGLAPASKERFERVVGIAKERTQERDAAIAERDAALQQYTAVEQTLKKTGATPEAMGRILVAMEYANSGDPTKIGLALDMIEQWRGNLARMAGRPVPGVDMLSEYPDLKQRVENGELDEGTAQEIAAARTGRREAETRSTTRSTQEQAIEQQAAQWQQRVSAAQANLTALGEELKKSDVDYKQKIGLLEKRGFFQRVAQNTPPEQWGDVFQAAYDAVGDAAASVRTPAPKPGQTPMQRSGTGTAGAAQPKTVRAAVIQALAE